MKNNLFQTWFAALAIAGSAGSIQAGSHTWSGAINGHWSVAGNWSSGGAPTNGESPLHLTFPPGATRFTITNDVTGLQADSLTFTDFGYSLHASPGKSLTLKGTTATNILCNGNNILEGSLGLVLLNTNLISVAANQQLTIKGPISGAGSVVKTGAGQLNFQGVATNSYTGHTLVREGELNVARGVSLNTPALAIPGPIFIGTRTGALNSATVNLIFSHQIAAGAPVSIFKSGKLFPASGVAQQLGPLTMDGGLIAGAPGAVLTLLADVTGTNACEIGCALSFGGTNRTFTVNGGTSGISMTDTLVDGGNNAGFTKLGSGSFTLGRSNSYGGLTLVKEGMLNLMDPFSLGRTNAGTIVTNAGALRFMASFTAGEALTLGGFGTYDNGSIYADTYTNTWSGPVSLAQDTRIQILFAQGRVRFTGPISGPGALDITGAGTLVFAGNTANAYAGATTVSSGRLQLDKTNTVAIAGPLLIGDNETLTNNATVQLLHANQIDDPVPVTIHASGLLDLSGFIPASDVIGSLAGSFAFCLT
jgi:fibronectin-binding autotransporter adhesin